jgi:hypothetical protein
MALVKETKAVFIIDFYIIYVLIFLSDNSNTVNKLYII